MKTFMNFLYIFSGASPTGLCRTVERPRRAFIFSFRAHQRRSAVFYQDGSEPAPPEANTPEFLTQVITSKCQFLSRRKETHGRNNNDVSFQSNETKAESKAD